MKKLLVNGNETDFELREKGEAFQVQLEGEEFTFRYRGQVGKYLYLEDATGRMHRLMVSPDG